MTIVRSRKAAVISRRYRIPTCVQFTLAALGGEAGCGCVGITDLPRATYKEILVRRERESQVLRLVLRLPSTQSARTPHPGPLPVRGEGIYRVLSRRDLCISLQN